MSGFVQMRYHCQIAVHLFDFDPFKIFKILIANTMKTLSTFLEFLGVLLILFFVFGWLFYNFRKLVKHGERMFKKYHYRRLFR